jgi:hypothetical protein
MKQSFNDKVDYSKDPTFLKRAQEAKEFLEKNGLPEELLKIREAQYGTNIRDDARDYSNDPAVIRSTQEAKEFLEKHPIPEDLLKMIGPQYGK